METRNMEASDKQLLELIDDVIAAGGNPGEAKSRRILWDILDEKAKKEVIRSLISQKKDLERAKQAAAHI